MNILQPNNGKEIHYIVSSHVYVKVWDYGKKFLLSHLKLPNVQTPIREAIWIWLGLTEGTLTDASELSHSTFEDAINKAVNNPYTTVYEFESYEDMAKHWSDIEYVDTITTTYKSEETCTDY